MSIDEPILGNLQNFILQESLNQGRNPVYLAYDPTTNCQAIIKTFPCGFKPEAFYMREKTLFQFLKHKNIITLHQAVDSAIINKTDLTCPSAEPGEFIQEKVSYLVLEYAIHKDLNSMIISKGPLPEILARNLFHQLVDAVSFVHSRYIAHMDLKCANLLIDGDYNLRVIDFDLSQSLETLNITSGGTLGYRCPELIRKRAGDLRPIDVYSMGVILFILVTGHPPYEEYHSNGPQGSYDGYHRLLRLSPEKFWDAHGRIVGKEFYSEEFKEIFMMMIEERAEKRATLKQIKRSKWYKKDVLSDEEYRNEMEKYLRRN